MRQVLPTKPLASAMRYGPFFAGHWKYFVFASQGLKQVGFSPGPLTTVGPAATAAEDASNAAIAATTRVRELMLSPWWMCAMALPAMGWNYAGHPAHRPTAGCPAIIDPMRYSRQWRQPGIYP